MRKSVAIVLLLLSTGCVSRVVSNTPRTALEQMLLTGAVDRALEKLELPEVRDKKVCLDFSSLKGYDADYVRVAVRARFARLGARLVEAREKADYVAEVASGSLGTEFKTTLVGLPSFPMPQTQLTSPEVPLYRSAEQTGMFKLLIFVHADGRFVAADQYYARADRDETFLLFWRLHRKDDVREGWERAELERSVSD